METMLPQIHYNRRQLNMGKLKDLIESIQDVPSWKDVVTELKKVDTLLTEISRTNSSLSESTLENIGNNAFRVASRYGQSAADYLSGVREAYLAGFDNADEIAELSLAAQNAGGITAELADQLIYATDQAYRMSGSVSELTKVLDGMNYISGQNAFTMADLAEGMAALAPTASSFGIDAGETAAALGTMITATHQSGSEAADALRTVLLHIRQIADETEDIDGEGLAKYEAACSALNVKLKEIKNSILTLRDPMKVLPELAAAYNRLSDNDPRRTNLLDSVGSSAGEQLDAFLRQWSTYETLLQQYAHGTGSMAEASEKTVNSWEGSLNRLSNTWASTVGNFTDSDAIAAAVNSLNSLLSIVNNITGKLGSFANIGLGAGLFLGFKNIGKRRMSIRIS